MSQSLKSATVEFFEYSAT